MLQKQHVLSADHQIPSADELKGRRYCKWHNATSHQTADCKVLRQQIQSAIEQGWLIFGIAAMKVDRNPFPINMVVVSTSSKGKVLAGPSDRPSKIQTDRHVIEEEVARRREFRPTSRHLAGMYSGRYWKEARR